MHIGQFGHPYGHQHNHGIRHGADVDGRPDHGRAHKHHRARPFMSPGFSGFGRRSAMQLLSQNLFASLNRSLQVNLSAAVSGYPASNSPQDLAGQVSSALQALLSNQQAQESSAQTPEQTIKTAKESVAEGIAETEQQIAAQNDLNDNVTHDLNTSRALLDNALSELGSPPTGSVTASVAQYSSNRSASISITTNDGDIVTINISAETGGERGTASVDGDGVATNVSTTSSYAHNSLTFTVDGELDRGERKSIRKLLQRIERAADKFFDGRVHKALHKLGRMKLNTRELQSFSVEMSSSASMGVAQLYQTNLPATQPADSGETDATVPAMISSSEMVALNVMVNEFVSVSKSQPENDLLTDPAESIAKLAGTMLATQAADKDPAFENGLDAAEKLIATRIDEQDDDD